MMNYAAAMNPKCRDVCGPKKLKCRVPRWLYTPAAKSRGARLWQTELIQLLFHPLFASLFVGIQATFYFLPVNFSRVIAIVKMPVHKAGQISWADWYLLWHSLSQLLKKEKKIRW